MMNTPFGAVAGAVVDETGLAHLGSPLAEQRALAEGSAIAPLDDRAVVTVTGEDRLSWLDSVSSQALTHLAPGESTELLILDPHGHIEHAAAVLDDGVTCWLITDRVDAEQLQSWLHKMRFRMRVEVRRADDEYAVVGGTPAALARVAAGTPNGVPLVWRDPWPGVAAGGWGYAPADPHPGTERVWAEAIVTRSERDRIADAAARGDLDIAGRVASEALRIAAWRPRRTDVDERMLPHEVDWMRTAVHLEKGCYRGQETVAKVHNLGHPPRRLVALHLDGSDSVLPSPGAPVLAGGEVVGAVVATALHYEDGPIALALVRRNTPLEMALVVATDDGPIAAAAEMIVPPEAGRVASVPRLPRLGRRPAAQ